MEAEAGAVVEVEVGAEAWAGVETEAGDEAYVEEEVMDVPGT